MNAHRSSRKFLADFNEFWIFSTEFWKIFKHKFCMKIRPVGAEVFQVGGWTDGQTWPSEEPLFAILRLKINNHMIKYIFLLICAKLPKLQIFSFLEVIECTLNCNVYRRSKAKICYVDFFFSSSSFFGFVISKPCNISRTFSCFNKTRNTYLLIFTPWSIVLLEKLTDFQLVRNSPHFMVPEVSLPHSQVPASYPYPQSAWTSPIPYIPFPKTRNISPKQIYRNTDQKNILLELTYHQASMFFTP
jgi:hypothetical protein